MKRFLLWFALLATAALAHPFGELAVDVTYQVTLAEPAIEVEAHLYLPEVSALSQVQRLDANKDGIFSDSEKAAYLPAASRMYESELFFTLNGRKLPVRVVQADLEVEEGPSGELHVMLLHYRFEVEVPPGLMQERGNRLELLDTNFTGTPGWKEIMVRGQGFAIDHGPHLPRTAAEALQDRASIELSRSGSEVTVAFPASHRPSPGVSSSNPMVDMLSGESFLLVALGLAFVLGALHALSPGHGKTVVAAYLIGSRGTIPQAILLGAVVTITHTFSVILLGLVTLFATQYILPETLLPWIGFVSGMLVAVMGVYLFRLRRREQRVKAEPHHGHQSAYLTPVQVVADGQLLTQPGWKVAAVESEDGPLVMGHSHGGRYHTHHVPEKVTLYSLITLGVSGGMVPCPDALVVLLSAIALNKIVLGLLILLAFSAGLASVLIAIGVVLVTAGKVVERYYPGQKLLDRVTLASYCVIVAMGLGIAYQSLASVGILRFF